MSRERKRDERIREDDDVPRPRGPRWGRRVFLFALLLVLLVTGGYWVWSNNSERRLTALLAQLRSEGEPVAPGDLFRQPISADQDAVPELRAAALAIDRMSADWKKFNDDVSFEEGLSPEHRELIKRIAGKESDVFALVRSARGKPDADWQLQFNSPLISVQLPDLNQMRDVGRIEQVAVYDRFLDGDHAEAVEHVRDTLGVGRAVNRQPFLVSHLVAAGINGLALQEVERLGPQLEVARPGGKANVAKPATPEQVRALIKDLLDETRVSEGFSDAMRGERVAQVDTGIAVAERRLSLAMLTGMAGGGGGGGGFNPLGLVPKGLLYDDARIMADFTTKLQRAAEQSPDYPTFKKNEPPMPPEVGGASPFHVLIRVMMPSFDRAVQRHFQARADRRMAATVLAIRLYQADHDGQLPAKLEDLVPNYLPAVPVDPMAAGRPIRYVRDNDRPRVYSAGENGTDEGGSDKPTVTRKVVTRWDREDAIYDLKPKPVVKEAEAPATAPVTGEVTGERPPEAPEG